MYLRCPVVGQSEQLFHRIHCPALGVGCAIDHLFQTGMQNRSRTHGARFQRHVQSTVQQPPAAQCPARRIDRHDFCMSKRRTVCFPPVISLADDPSGGFLHHHCPHRNFAHCRSLCCQFQSTHHVPCLGDKSGFRQKITSITIRITQRISTMLSGPTCITV